MKNPFSVKTPEMLTANDIASLFIDVFSDFPKVLEFNHTFIHGTRGTGKSMMLRYLEPTVQLEAGKINNIADLEFFAIHIPIKTANYNIAELERLQDTAYWLHTEHFFITSICSTIISKLLLISPAETTEEIRLFLDKTADLINLFTANSYENVSTLKDLGDIFNKEKISTKRYLSLISFSNENSPYNGAIFDYEDFFIQFIRLIKNLSFTPNGPIFMMIDDADNLNIKMQNILNNWVSYRTTNELCLKISTQKKYKTWRTTQNILIESPHDFIEIDINSIYTAKQTGTYYNRVEKIVAKRLERAGINISPKEFFPIDQNQYQEIEKIKINIGKQWDDGNKVSSRKHDDITRYSVSEYMKNLETRKKSNLYSYAGFDSLINISSGMIRYFLEPASRMFSDLQSSESENILSIPPNIQDKVIKKWSEEYVLQEFDKVRHDEMARSSQNMTINKVEKLKNLIEALGMCFRKKLVSNDSERRFISFMLTKPPSTELQEILDLAIEWGFLNLSSISNKEGSGRNTLYTLNRRLTPHYKLDPTGYAAHLSITPDLLLVALTNPNTFVNSRLGLEKQDSTIQNILDLE